MAAECFAPIRGRVYRVIQVDACGRPVTGAGSVGVGKFVQAELSPEYQDGTEYLLEDADGAPCVNEKGDPFLKRLGATINLCNIDPDDVVIVTGEQLIFEAGAPPTGRGVMFDDSVITARFSLEIWQRVAGSQACDEEGNEQYVYWAFPNMGAAKIQSYTIENGPSQLAFMAETRGAHADWFELVGDVYLPAGTDPTGQHYLFSLTSTAPPADACGAQAL